MTRKRIALISVWFPPKNGVAVNRMKAFAEYLGEDYELEVYTEGDSLTTKNEDFGTIHYIPISSFWKKIKHKNGENKLIHKFKSALKIISIRLKVSEYSKWKKKMFTQIKACHEEKPFDVIISSFGPVEPHEIAFDVKKMFQDLVWIADMRDEMSQNPFALESAKKELEKKEQMLAPEIDAVTTVSAPIADMFKDIFPNVKYVEEVRNGYNHDLTPSNNFNERFTMVYAGTLYGKNKPGIFFECVVELLEEGQLQNDIHLRFVGTNHNFSIPQRLKEFVEFTPKVPYMQAVEYMRTADCNLLFHVPVPQRGRYSGKLFDYLSVEKPILAMVDKTDVAAELIEEHQCGRSADFYDKAEIKQELLAIYSNWKKRERWPVRSEKTKTLHRKHQIDRLKKLIEEIT